MTADGNYAILSPFNFKFSRTDRLEGSRCARNVAIHFGQWRSSGGSSPIPVGECSNFLGQVKFVRHVIALVGSLLYFSVFIPSTVIPICGVASWSDLTTIIRRFTIVSIFRLRILTTNDDSASLLNSTTYLVYKYNL